MDSRTQAKKIHEGFNSSQRIARITLKDEKRKVLEEDLKVELEEIEKNGFVFLRNVLTAQQLKDVRDATNSIIHEEKRTGRNIFEGKIKLLGVRVFFFPFF
jgi:septin family protein